MRFRHVIAVVLAATAIYSSTAQAVLQVNVEVPTYICNGQDQTVFVDVFVTDLDNSNEQLSAFTVAVNGVGFSQNGMRFLPPVRLPSAAHPYVFKDVEAVNPTDFGSTFNRVQVGADVIFENVGVNVTPTNNGLFRIPVFVSGSAAPGVYPIVVDMSATDFAGIGAPIIVVQGPPGANVYLCPEPSAVALLALPAAGLLRRRARAPGRAVAC